MSKELIEKAKELGIENAEALTASQLKKAVEAAESKIAADNAVIEKASSLGIETKDKSIADLSKEIADLEAAAEEVKKEIAKQSRQTEMLAFLSEYLGITDIDSLTQEEVKALLEERVKADEKGAITAVVKEGKTDKSYKASNGKEYVFKEDAPAAFRYLGVHQTQEKWIADSDSIELMIAGNLSFLTLKK